MTRKKAENYLNSILIGNIDKPATLRHMASVAGEVEKNLLKTYSKEQLVSILSKYFCTPNRFDYLWNSLTDAERKIVSLHFWCFEFAPLDYADDIAEEFNLPARSNKSEFQYTRTGLEMFMNKYARKNSMLWLLFPNTHRKTLFDAEIRKTIGTIKREYTKAPNNLAFTIREDRRTDFANIIRYCNSNKTTITKNGFFNKASALKIWNYCGYEEFASDINAKPEEMRTIQGLLVTLPLTILCTISGLLTMMDGTCAPSEEAISLINLPYEKFIKKLFNDYLNSKKFDEISLMSGMHFWQKHHPSEARKNLSNELKQCPVNQVINTKEFERIIRITNISFARENLYKEYANDNHYYYYNNYSTSWEHYEHTLINMFLTFCGALGIIDIAWGKIKSTFLNDINQRLPVAFRINQLGAFVLGLTNKYRAATPLKPQNNDGFTVLPDYTIIVPNSINRLKHEVYFERLFTKVSVTEETSIYKLDFGTIVRAIDRGISIQSLRDYMSASDKPMPENVLRAFADWEKQAGRIRLRKVTILECEDEALLEEVIRYKGMGELVRQKIKPAIEVDGNATKEIKKVIEKNKRFCKDII